MIENIRHSRLGDNEGSGGVVTAFSDMFKAS